MIEITKIDKQKIYFKTTQGSFTAELEPSEQEKNCIIKIKGNSTEQTLKTKIPNNTSLELGMYNAVAELNKHAIKQQIEELEKAFLELTFNSGKAFQNVYVSIQKLKIKF